MTSRADDIVVASPPIAAEPVRDVAWWAKESARVGSDWPGVLDGARALLAVAVGETMPADNTFDRLCREADRKAAAGKKNPKLERLRELMADDVSFERAWHELRDRRPTPEMTIEAVKQAVRDRGVAALSEPSTRDRLLKCDIDARKRFDLWLTDFKARIAAV
jgi:hypothetical protein